MNGATFRRLALSLHDTSEVPHFERAAFRTPLRIFATLAADGAVVNLKLEPLVQEGMVDAHPSAFRALNGAWGRQGWTAVTLAEVSVAELKPVLMEAHAMASKKTASNKRAGKKTVRKTARAR